MNNRIKVIDYLKTIAIIAVLLYHVGFLKNGYLGVEIFFVISGYLFIKGNKTKLEKGEFNPIKFIYKKIFEFWPLILIAGGICLTIGYIIMLPDDYENLAQSVVASNFFANNILQAITTKNYWDIVNTYKPLMHTWYIGVLLQTFVFLAIILWAARTTFKKDISCKILISLSIISFLLFVLPIFSPTTKFYFLPFRLFEITVGGLLVFLPKFKIKDKTLQFFSNLSIIVLLFSLFSGYSISNSTSLVITVGSTCVVLYTQSIINEDYGINTKIYSILSFPGRYSYDIYIWHQVVIAFLYYFIFQDMNNLLILLVFIISIGITFLSISLRKKFSLVKKTKKRVIMYFMFMGITTIISINFYIQSGVVRDVPELDISISNIDKNMHANYIDIPYSWDKSFSDDSKIKVLVMGDSFGRDFANILNESSFSERLEISYIYGDNASDKVNRVEEADLVFYGTNAWDVSDWVIQNVDSEKLYIIGNKSFGNSNGIIYKNKNEDWYFSQRVKLKDEFILNNNAMRGIYGNHYIDMVSPIMVNNEIAVFSDDHFYISQDCRHLTKRGAQYYSRILDLNFITN